MISQWWSFALVTIGVTGLVLVYARPKSVVGPYVGIAVQILWIAYAVVTRQWWFLLSAFAYGGANIYGLLKRRREAPSRQTYACGCEIGGKAECAYATGDMPARGMVTVHGVPRPEPA